MKKEEKVENLVKIVELKKELLGIRLKTSMGETIQNNKAKSIKKEIARIYTKLNSNK